MNEFWLWFVRPIAEFLGALAFLGVLIVLWFVGFTLYYTWEKYFRRKAK